MDYAVLKLPPPVKELEAFESELIELVKNIKFRKIKNQPQNKLKEDIKKTNQPDKTLTFAGKSSNMYRLTKEEYVKMRRNAITSTYKKTNNNIKKRIDIKGKQIKENVDKGILDRMNINSKNTCFITLKDHKENVLNNPTVRLIKSAKNELGRISKAILDNINKRLCTSLNINQWKNTASVIEWFKRIEQKHLYKFIIFDIKDFYPSIQEELLNKGLRFAQEYIDITSKDKEIIYHARKLLLFDEKDTWMKKQSGLFDVTMGAYYGAEVCELVGTYVFFIVMAG